ncbi:molecular chaperone, partial [Acinetobacter sp. YH16049]|uniref:fimbrial biogenesis chaperone n=1 Tax=Acinetobacter sp. YH16049 TaxID=2601188 RepID=UPI00211E3A8A
MQGIFEKILNRQHIYMVTLLASSFCSLAQAASLQVSPILVEFSSQEKAKELWLTNTGKTNIRAQVRMQEWTQLNNQEILEPTKKLIASPLITEIKPGQRQLVRLIKPANTNSTHEQAFRVLV